ncbi:MAG: methionyl-tRNA formyltransferase [Mycobacteriales bacterium]
MRLVFAGTPEPAVPALRALLASQHDVVAVLTRPDAPAGRGRKLVASPVAQLATEHGIELLRPQSPKDPVFQNRLRELAPDCCPVVAYGALLPASALEIPRLGWLNLHFSLLPAWRGAAPVQRAIMHGDQITGASVFAIEPSLDSGPVYGSLTEPITATDTAGDLLGRLADAGAGLLVSCLDGMAEGALTPISQPADGVSLAPKLTSDDARVVWQHPAFAVDRRIRSCTPTPGAWTTFRGERVKLGPVALISDGEGSDSGGSGVGDSDSEALPPGALLVQSRRVLVGTVSGAVELSAVQPAGRRPMPATDWVRGLRPALTDSAADMQAEQERLV